MSHALGRRLAVVVIAIPLVFGIVYAGGWVLAAALGLVGLLGTREVYALAERRGVRPIGAAGYVFAAGLPLLVQATLPGGLGLAAVWIAGVGAVWLIGVMLAALRWRAPADGPLGSVAVTVFAPLYAAGLPAFLLVLRTAGAAPSAWAATWLVFLPLVLTWICDTAAMAGGVAFGGPKLAPVLSPNKTWAGGIAGSLAALIAAPAYGALVLDRLGVTVPVWPLVIVGLVVAVFGQLGDIAESLFKREAGVKDSGALLPGHGGILDRLDSLYWVIPLTTLTLGAFGIV